MTERNPAGYKTHKKTHTHTLALHNKKSDTCNGVNIQLALSPKQINHHIFYMHRNTGCPNKSARFNFVTNAPFIQKVLIFLFQYKVHILRLIVEHNIRQMSPTTLLAHSCCFIIIIIIIIIIMF